MLPRFFNLSKSVNQNKNSIFQQYFGTVTLAQNNNNIISLKHLDKPDNKSMYFSDNIVSIGSNYIKIEGKNIVDLDSFKYITSLEIDNSAYEINNNLPCNVEELDIINSDNTINLDGMNKLKVLSITDNTGDYIKYNRELVKICIKSKNITHFNFNNLQRDCPYLEEINIVSNNDNWKHIPILPKFPELKCVRLRGVSGCYEFLRNNTHINILDITCSSDLTLDTIEFDKVKSLYLYNNNLLNLDFLKNFRNLENLTCLENSPLLSITGINNTQHLKRIKLTIKLNDDNMNTILSLRDVTHLDVENDIPPDSLESMDYYDNLCYKRNIDFYYYCRDSCTIA
jgi:hypothetical protein